jgi:hypothetical protein
MGPVPALGPGCCFLLASPTTAMLQRDQGVATMSSGTRRGHIAEPTGPDNQ